MLFIPVLIAAVILYIIGQRVLSTIIFFFFLFDGFQVVPEIFFNTFVGVSKSVDFASIYITFLFLFGIYKYNDFIPINKVSKCIGIYLLFISISSSVSLFYYHINIVEIVRTVRPYLFVLSYFILRRLTSEEIKFVLKILFIVVCIQSLLFIIQVTIDVPLLINPNAGEKIGFIRRYYNTPIMLLFMAFYAIFANPFKGHIRVLSIFTVCLVVILPLHRSLILTFAAILVLGVILNMNDIKRFLKYIPLIVVLFFSSSFLLIKFIGLEKTLTDITNVVSGEYMDLSQDFELDSDSTLLFRMLHFFERYVDVTDTKVGLIFGDGFMSEGSQYTNGRFDFQIGLTDDVSGQIIQVETGDISWSNMIIRYGIVGTLIYMFMFLELFVFYFKHRKNKDSLIVLQYMMIVFALSFTSISLYAVSSLVIPLFMFDKVNSADRLVKKK